MKKVGFGIIIWAMALSFASCSSMESDAKKVAKRAYKIGLIYDEKWDTPNFTRSDDAQILEYIEYASKMFEKHGNDRETFNQLVEKELKKLKSEREHKNKP